MILNYGEIVLVAGCDKLIKPDDGNLTETDEVLGQYRSVIIFESNNPVPVKLTSLTGSISEVGVFWSGTSDFVSLRVYDMLGQKVQTLVGEFQEAETYSVSFNADGLSSGFCFYKLYPRNRL